MSPEIVNTSVPSTGKARTNYANFSSTTITAGRTNNHEEGSKHGPSPSSFLLPLTFCYTITRNANQNPFRRLGCSSTSGVLNPSVRNSSVPSSTTDSKNAKKSNNAAQRSARKIDARRKKKKSQVVDSDAWCSLGIPFSIEADSVGCVVSRRPAAPRGRMFQSKERVAIPDFKFAMDANSRELIVLQSSLHPRRIMRLGDRFRNMRLDTEHMTHEELLALGDRIGHQSTGLSEEQIDRCLRKTKHPGHHWENESKCSICQEDYEVEDRMASLKCGHKFHLCCIEQWLSQRNACPFCKSAAYQG